MKKTKIHHINFKYLLSILLIVTLSFLIINNTFSQELKITHSMNNKLTDLQKYVTQHDGTEKPFENEYWNNKEDGIYVDVVSGEALFSSKDKFDSKTGWPSFTKPIKEREVVKKIDNKFGMSRVEARSRSANSHLGHIFNDGPKEKGGMRYCINSAALRFIAKKDLEKEGYGQFLSLFKKNHEDTNSYEKAILSGGCFWGMEELIGKLDGIIDIKTGYIGGSVENPSYELISTGLTGHAESIKITFDPAKISYEKILRFFFQIHDATTLNKQGNDLGTQYRSAIFYLNDKQKKIAQDLIKKANKSGIFPGEIVTKVTKATKFYDAEDYHQDYLEKNPGGYTCHKIRKDWVF